jgi:glycosyltransferase involved in cell wall biosynthesis
MIVKKTKIIHTATVALSLDYLLKGQLAFLNNFYEVVAVSGADEHLENVKNREGLRTVNVPMQRAIRPLQDLVTLWKLFLLFKKEKPQIVHSITPKAGLLSMVAAKMAGVPIRMHTFTGLIFPSKKGIFQELLIAMDRLLCWAATTIIPEGNGVKNDLIAYKITSKPLTVLANGNVNGIDTNYFSTEAIPAKEKENLRKVLQLEPSDFVYVFVGRLVGDKGINELVAAFKNLSNANVKLLLVGPYEKELDALKAATLQEIEQNKNILTVGFQQDVRAYFAISDALIFPSYREGFPNVVLQAGAMGLPSIVTNINGCNEIIIEGKNGIIIPVKNSNAIYNAMKKMMEEDSFRNNIQQNTRQMIVSRYEQQVVWEAILTEYKSLLKHV